MRYYTVTHLDEPLGKAGVADRRDDFIREVVAEFRSFNPRPETARVRYVAPGRDFRDCEHASQAEDMPGCPGAHVYASVEGKPPPRLARKLPNAKTVHRVPQREPYILPADIREALV
jgi:hypothetical protein